MSRSRLNRTDSTTTSGSSLESAAGESSRSRRKSVHVTVDVDPAFASTATTVTGVTRVPAQRTSATPKAESTRTVSAKAARKRRSRTQGALATRSGLRTERRVTQLLTELKHFPQPYARITGTRLSGKGQILDNACWLDGLDGSVTPLYTDGGLVNMLISVKTQFVAGTAEQKIATEIGDLGHMTDTTGTPCCLVLHAPGFTLGQMFEIYRRAELAGVAVVTIEELEDGLMPAAVLAVQLAREELRNPFSLAKIVRTGKKLSPTALGYLEREYIRAPGQL